MNTKCSKISLQELLVNALPASGAHDTDDPGKAVDVQINEARSRVKRKVLARLSRHESLPANPKIVGKPIPVMTNLWGVEATPTSALSPIVTTAYMKIRQGWAVDRIIADPELNELFLRQCWEMGAKASPSDLNRTLMNLRKSGGLNSDTPSRRFVIGRSEMEPYAYACEFAVKHLQVIEYKSYHRAITVDNILCDKQLTEKFDTIVKRIEPGYSPLEYHWAILSMRKRDRRAASTSVQPRFDPVGCIGDLKSRKLSQKPGLFWLHTERDSLFFGHTSNLRNYFDRMLSCHPSSIVPDWLLDRSYKQLNLAVLNTPTLSGGEKRDALVVENARTIGSRLNYLGQFRAA